MCSIDSMSDANNPKQPHGIEWEHPFSQEFPSLPFQPIWFPVEFLEAFDHACSHLDIDHLENYLFSETYLKDIDRHEFLKRMEPLFSSTLAIGVTLMDAHAVWCTTCHRGVGGIQFRTPKDAEPQMIWDFAFLFYVEEGQLVGMVVCDGDLIDHPLGWPIDELDQETLSV